MRQGLGIRAYISGKSNEWIEENLINRSDDEAAEIDRLLIFEDKSPDKAAHAVFSNGIPRRRMEGLKYLAREEENRILEKLGSTLDGSLEDLRERGRVEIHIRRLRRLARMAEREGMTVEVVSVLKRLG
jgi:hypothetical protein